MDTDFQTTKHAKHTNGGASVPASRFPSDFCYSMLNVGCWVTEMLESTDARLDPVVLELLRDTRKFCPRLEREMVIRVAEKGPNPGSKFWGCSGYPKCHYTMPAT